MRWCFGYCAVCLCTTANAQVASGYLGCTFAHCPRGLRAGEASWCSWTCWVKHVLPPAWSGLQIKQSWCTAHFQIVRRDVPPQVVRWQMVHLCCSLYSWPRLRPFSIAFLPIFTSEQRRCTSRLRSSRCCWSVCSSRGSNWPTRSVTKSSMDWSVSSSPFSSLSTS